MAKPKPLPMPVDVVAGSKHVQFMGGALERALWLIVCRFWLSGAVLDGFTETTAREVCKADGATWERIKGPLMAALNDILPDLATRHAVEHEKRLNMRRSLEAGQLKGRIVMFERRQKQNAATVEKSPAVHRTPKTAARYVDETNPMTPQALAALPKREAEGARMADK